MDLNHGVSSASITDGQYGTLTEKIRSMFRKREVLFGLAGFQEALQVDVPNAVARDEDPSDEKGSDDVSDVPSAEKDKCIRVPVMFEGAEEETGSIVPSKRKKPDAESSVNVEDRIPRKSDPYENPLSYKKTKKDREEVVGWRVKVWWPLNDKYYEGFIESYDHATDKHKVVYFDGDIEYLILKHRQWYRVGEELDSQHNQGYAEKPWRFLEQSVGSRRISVRFEDSESHMNTKKVQEEVVGWRVMVYWPLDKQYYEGIIESYDHAKNKHKVVYVDGDIEYLVLERQEWHRVDETLHRRQQDQGYAEQPWRFLEQADGARRISVRFE